MLTHILRHIFQYELIAYRWLEYFLAISVSIYTKLTRDILTRDRNVALEPNFRKSFSKSRILSPKNSYLSISTV